MKLTTLLLTASFLIPASLAGAQSLLLPDDGASTQVKVLDPAATLNIEKTEQAPETKADAPVSRIIPFAEPTDRFELTGEADVEQFTFHLTDKQLVAGGNLVIAFKNAVSVLPDDGQLSIEVNGRTAGQLKIASPFDFAPNRIALDARQLRAGLNVVRVAARQHHRVDCSLDATYELWTRIDPVTSGFEPTQPVVFSKFEDLYAAGRMDGGATELRLVLPEAANAEMLNAALPIVQALALYLDREDLIVTVADRPGEGPGIDLFVGNGTTNTIGVGMKMLAEAPYGVTVRNSGDTGRAAVIFRAAAPAEFEGQLVEALRGQMNAGLKDNRSTPDFGRIHARAEHEFKLTDAGLRSTSFAGRLMRTHFEMVMPADFYPAEYATMDLKLSALTSPGLDPAAQLLIRVNDRVINSFPFRNTDGQNFNGKLIELPLRAFRPGVNKIEMLAELPDDQDKACAPGTRDESKPRYIQLGDTTFSVPPLARVTRLPDLAAFSGNAYPYGDAKPFDIYLERPDSHSASAAMTILARLALSAGKPLKGNFRVDRAALTAKGNALVIAVEALNAHLGNDPEKTIAANASFKIDDHAAGVMKSDMIATAAVAKAQEIPSRNGEDQLIQAFENSTEENNSERSWTSRLRTFLFGASSRFGNWLSYENPDQVFVSREDTLLSVTQLANADDTGIRTVIRANTPDELSKGVRRLTDPAVWRSLNGGAALIDARSLALVNLAGERQQFVEVTDQSVGNYRRIAAAWFSDNFQFYVALVILLIGLFAAWLGKFVPTRGVRTVK